MSHLFPDVDRAWHLREIRAREAWQKSKGAGIRVALIDTGYTDHVELTDAVDAASSFDFLRNVTDAKDPLFPDPGFQIGGNTIGHRFKTEWPGHGTFTGSVLASRGIVVDPPPPGSPPGGTDAVKDAQGNVVVRGSRITGVAPEATLVVFRAERSVVTIETAPLGRAINRAVATGCHVISISLGGVHHSFLHQTVINAMQNNLIVVAAGGQVWPLVPFPAQYWECIAAGATNADHLPAPWSTHGPGITVSAPGESVWHATPRPIGVTASSGTSFATPCVAGTAALWLATHGRDALLDRYRGRNYLQTVFRHIIETTARNPLPVPWDPSMGPGILDAEAVVNAPLPDLPPDITAAGDAGPTALGGLFATAQQANAQFAVMSLFAPNPSRTFDSIVRDFGTELLHIFMQHPRTFELLRLAVDHLERGESNDAEELIRGVVRLLLQFASRTLAQLLRPL